MLDLEVSPFVCIGGRDLCGQPSVQGEGRDGCTFGGSPIFVDDSPFDKTRTIRRNNPQSWLSSARTQNCCHKQRDRSYPAVHSHILPQLHLESLVCGSSPSMRRPVSVKYVFLFFLSCMNVFV